MGSWDRSALGRRALTEALQDSRQYTKALVEDLSDAQWRVPMLPTINPILWEIGHIGWFMEHWCLRDGGHGASMLRDADSLYNSSTVAHDTRWELPLPSRATTLGYIDNVLDATLNALAHNGESDDELYFFRLALYHEDMHAEAFGHLRQTLGYAAAPTRAAADTATRNHADSEDARFDGGDFEQGVAADTGGFVFDNEKWSHRVPLAPYAIARDPVTQGEFRGFVDDGGYRHDALWSNAGRAWRDATHAEHPVCWRRDGADWEQRVFDRWLPLQVLAPVRHVSAHEAEAYCRWSGRRLPSEAEWECAALNDAIAWGASVWEWTSSPFAPYPGFRADAYSDYSEPWFHTHRSVRGGSVLTASRLRHPRFRNFYQPQRNDVLIGFRTARSQ